MTFLKTSGSVLIQPQGHLDIRGAASLQRQIEAIDPTHYRLWILDMAQVDFIDSAGIVALISGLKSARKHQCRLVVCNPSPSAKVIFEISQLDQAFEIFDSHADLAESCALGSEISALLCSKPTAA
jgi:anti-sigma B factor antagonist